VVFSSGALQDNAVIATALKTEINYVQTSTFVEVSKVNNNLQFVTHELAEPLSEQRSVAVEAGENRSNLFGPKAVLHEVDGFLAYKPN
jgi:hypothetical protein